MQKVKILTSQNVSLDYPLAQVGDRLIANIIDFCIQGAYAFSMLILFSLLSIQGGMAPQIIVAIPLFLYNLLMEIFLNGQTLGMRVRRIKVIRLDGKELTVGNYLLRWIFRLVDVAISFGGVAIVSIAISEKGQRLGDMAAGTTVVKLTNVLNPHEAFIAEADEAYKVQFEAVKHLTDQQISIVKDVLTSFRKTGNIAAADEVSRKIKDLLKIQSDLPPLQFLEVIVRDYQHLMGKL